MDYLYQNKFLRERRKNLRNEATPQEIILWKYLRRSNLGIKFQRQYSVGPYIIDFYCSQKRLAIELDGQHHINNKEYDHQRTLYLKNCNITVLRFWNYEVDKNIQEVIKNITPFLEDSEDPSYFKRGK